MLITENLSIFKTEPIVWLDTYTPKHILENKEAILRLYKIS